MRRRNQAASVKGRTVWWVAAAPEMLEARLKRYEALVKVTGDKRFVEDTSTDTQDALSEKRKERDELRGALARDIERAFLSGTVFQGGQEIELEGGSDLKEPIVRALAAVIPNVYPRFAIADKSFDFARQIKALLNPATANLHAVAPELDLFDTQGSLQRDSALVGQVLEVLHDIEDEGGESVGAAILDARDAKGFKGFCRAPFGWPDELVRLVLAACFRAGAIYLERQSGAGPAPIYDYAGSDDDFAKVNTFKKVVLHVAETSLSVEQIKQASKALIELGVNGVAESGNAIAGAVRELGAVLKTGLERGEAARATGPADSGRRVGRREYADRAHHGPGPHGVRHVLPESRRTVEGARRRIEGAARFPRRQSAPGIRVVAQARRTGREPPAPRVPSGGERPQSSTRGHGGDPGGQGGRRALVGLPGGLREGLRSLPRCLRRSPSGRGSRRGPPDTPPRPRADSASARPTPGTTAINLVKSTLF